MLIAIVDFHVAAGERTTAVDFLVDQGKDMIKLAGNAGHRVFTEAGSETHVGLIHEWKTPEDFVAYMASPLFARSGEILRPMMIAPPASRRLVAEPFEEVDG